MRPDSLRLHLPPYRLAIFDGALLKTGTCAAPGCEQPVRRKYCKEHGGKFAAAQRQRDYRTGGVSRGDPRSVSLAADDGHKEVGFTFDVGKWIFADDHERHQRMGYIPDRRD